MKKLTAMLLSLVMCLSLMAVPAQAGFTPIPDGTITIGGDPADPGDSGKDDPDEPGITVQGAHDGWLPREKDETPTD